MQLRYRARCLVVWPGLKNNRTDKVFYLLATKNQIPQYALGFAAVTHEFAVVAKGGGSLLFHAGTIPAAPSNGDGDPLSQKRSRRLTQTERDAGPRPQHGRCHL